MKREIITCDVCGVERGESNHWFMGISPVSSGDWTSIKKWSDETAKLNTTVKHLCGQLCVHKFIDAFMEGK
jgi:hypothetical protein